MGKLRKVRLASGEIVMSGAPKVSEMLHVCSNPDCHKVVKGRKGGPYKGQHLTHEQYLAEPNVSDALCEDCRPKYGFPR